MRLVVHACAILIAGCTTVENEALPDPIEASKTIDEAVFHCNVEPVLVKQCSFIACHGNSNSALRVFSIGKLRSKPPKNAEEATADLTTAERLANFRSAAAFGIGLDDPGNSWLLRKPLAPELGGYAHLGGVIYRDTSDPSFTAIYHWLKGDGRCN